MGGPAQESPGRAVVGLFLDQDVQGFTEPALGPLGHQLIGQAGELLDPAGDLGLVQVAGQRRGFGAVLIGVAEDPDRIELRIAQEALKFPQVIDGLAGEADDEVGPDPGVAALLPDLVDQGTEQRIRNMPSGRPAYFASLL